MFRLLFTNRGYRNLWLAQLISFAGDWFTLVALIRMVKDETGARIFVGLMFAAQLAPSLLFSALAGSVADRIPRRTVMIACDLLRAAGALGFLIPGIFNLQGNAFLICIFSLVLFQHSLTSFFRPAASASVPHLVKSDELSAAGTLDGLSWSLGLIVGSALGGIAVDQLGLTECFILDSLTFLASAMLVRSLPLPRVAAAVRGKLQIGYGDFRELFDELKRNRELWPPILAKCAWGVGAAQLFLLTEFGNEIVGAAAASTGFGLLYAARGAGTALGPAFARRMLGESNRGIRISIAYGFAAAAVFYCIFGFRPPTWIALICVAGAHGGGSMIWIGATVLVQRLAPDRVRGRAFALEMALHTITACACPLAAAALCDLGYAPANLVIFFAALTGIVGLAWSYFARGRK
ncbi:MAG: MFS transporter [Planctomycetota bacterium]